MAEPRHRRAESGTARSLIAAALWAFAGLGFVILLTVVLRPFDVVLARSAVGPAVLGLATGGALVAAGFVSRAMPAIRVAAGVAGAVVVGCGILALVAVALFGAAAVLFGTAGAPQTYEQVEVEGTDLVIAVVGHEGGLGVPKVVLKGRLGPFPRERTLVSSPGPCLVEISSPAPRRIEVTLAGGISDCQIGPTVRDEERFVFEVGDDGWSTTRIEP